MLISTNAPAYYRLQVLYFLDCLGIPVTLAQLSRVFMEEDWVPYFDLQQSVVEMTHGSPPFIKEELHQPGRLLYVTQEGADTLALFGMELMASFRDACDAYVARCKDTLLLENQLIATYARLESGEYLVSCRVLEGDIVVLDLSLSVVTLAQAKQAVARWPERATVIYQVLIQELMNEDEGGTPT